MATITIKPFTLVKSLRVSRTTVINTSAAISGVGCMAATLLQSDLFMYLCALSALAAVGAGIRITKSHMEGGKI